MADSSDSLPKVFCAIDTPDMDRAAILIRSLAKVGCGIKIGLEFFNSHGPSGVSGLMAQTPDVPLFLDLKYHDIPNTVAGAIRAVCTHVTPAYLNVHAAGGLEMMRAAKEACSPETKLLAVTVLTSIDDTGLIQIGQKGPAGEQVERLALLAREAGLDGVVCSAHEIAVLRAACGSDFALMVPGIRPAGSASGDQKRVMTPQEAIESGATHLVIGRPITQAPDPAQAAQDILAGIS